MNVPDRITGIPAAEDAVRSERVCAIKTTNGEVWTWGSGGALGRETNDGQIPGKVHFNEKVARVASGKSVMVAITETGQVYAWGSFRDRSGMTVDQPLPVKIGLEEVIVKIVPGDQDVLLLARSGSVFTIESWPQEITAGEDPDNPVVQLLSARTKDEFENFQD